jgi:hypothetical protein
MGPPKKSRTNCYLGVGFTWESRLRRASILRAWLRFAWWRLMFLPLRADYLRLFAFVPVPLSYFARLN